MLVVPLSFIAIRLLNVIFTTQYPHQNRCARVFIFLVVCVCAVCEHVRCACLIPSVSVNGSGIVKTTKLGSQHSAHCNTTTILRTEGLFSSPTITCFRCSGGVGGEGVACVRHVAVDVRVGDGVRGADGPRLLHPGLARAAGRHHRARRHHPRPLGLVSIRVPGADPRGAGPTTQLPMQTKSFNGDV